MNARFRPAIVQFLKVMGYNDKKIETMSYYTELTKDLKLEGDSLLETIEVIIKKFDVDMSSMNYDLYGRDEGYYLSSLRLFDRFKKEKLSLRPITLKMIEESIMVKKWLFD